MSYAKEYRIILTDDEVDWLKRVVERSWDGMLVGMNATVSALKSGEATHARRVLGQLKRLRSMEELGEVWVDKLALEDWIATLEGASEDIRPVIAEMKELVE